jgi:hypothetical protein
MAGLLRSKNLWGYAAGTKIRPADTTDSDGNITTSAAQQTWDDNAEKAAGLLAVHAGPVASSFFTSQSDPKQMWEDLKRGFNAPRPGRRMLALRELLNAEQQPGEPLDKLGQHIYQLHQQFTSLQDSSYTIDMLRC